MYEPFDTIDKFRQFIHIKEHGVIEIGYVNFSQKLARTRQATEVNFLLLQFSFDILGYRRVEWKSNVLNKKSQRVAIRLCFQYDDTCMKAQICKNQSRDLSCFSIVDDEWPQVKQELQ